jgi:CrcB protein
MRNSRELRRSAGSGIAGGTSRGDHSGTGQFPERGRELDARRVERSNRPVERLLWVMLGGARYLAVAGLQRWLGNAFPWGTFAVNLAGSFLLGLLLPVGLRGTALSPTAVIALSVGVLGGFTTYSSFSVETLALLQRGSHAAAFANVAGTLVLCLAASWLGAHVGARLV